MGENLMAESKKCEKCEVEYLVNHSSPDCPHERLIDLMASKLTILKTNPYWDSPNDASEGIYEAGKQAQLEHNIAQLAKQKADSPKLREVATIVGLKFHKGLRLASDASPSCDFAWKYIGQMPPEIWEEICCAVAKEILSLFAGQVEQAKVRGLEAGKLLGAKEERERIQKYIDENNIYQVEFGYYEPPLNTKWLPLKTKRINILEVGNE